MDAELCINDKEKCEGGARGETIGEMEGIKDDFSEEDHQDQRV